jgi:hypothetical protein
MLAQRGIRDVYLFAPQDSEQFYALMGYEPQEEVIVKMGMQQRRMKKNLHPETNSPP